MGRALLYLLLLSAISSPLRAENSSRTESGFCFFCWLYDKPPAPAKIEINEAPAGSFDHFFSKIKNVGHEIMELATAPLSYAQKIQDSLFARKKAPKGYCLKGVRCVLNEAGLFKSLSSTKCAKDAFEYPDGTPGPLQKEGFYDDPNACHRPGVVLVYDKAKPGSYIPNIKNKNGRIIRRGNETAGDTCGHIEILGLDHMYYHFNADPQPYPINDPRMFGPDRRPTKHCLVKGPQNNGVAK